MSLFFLITGTYEKMMWTLKLISPDLHHPYHLKANIYQSFDRQEREKYTTEYPSESGLVKDVLESGREKVAF
jgi:hypothetical protein